MGRTRSRAATTAGRPPPRPERSGPAARRARRGGESWSCNGTPRARSCAHERLHRLNGGQHRVRNNRPSPLHAPRARADSTQSPSAGALRAARRRALSRGAGGPRAHRADASSCPSAPTYDPWAWIIWGREILHLDLVDRRRAVVEAAAGPADHAVRALRRPRRRTCGSFVARAGAIAGVVMAFRVARRLGGVAGRRRRRGRLRRRAVDAAQLGARQLRGPARRARAGRRRPPPRRAHPPGLPARGSAPRCCAPRPGPSSASTGCGCCRRDPGRARARSPAAFVVAAGPVAAARAVGLGRPAARRPPRAQPARQQRRPSPTTRSARCSRQFGDDAHAGRCGSAWGARRDDGAAPGLGPPRAPRRARLGAGRARSGSREVAVHDQRRLQRQRALPDHAGGASPACWPGRASAGSIAGPAGALVRERRSPSRRCPSWPRVGLRRAERPAPRRRPCVGLLPGAADRRPRRRHRARPVGRDRLKACGDGLHRRRSRCPSVAWLLHVHTTAVRSASAPGDAPPQVPAVVLRSRTTSRSRPVPALESSAARRPCRRSRSPAAGASWGAARERRRRDASRARGRGVARLAHGPPGGQPAEVAARPGVPGRAVARRCARRPSTRASGSTRGCRSASRSHPLVDIPGVLRKDGSPPLYYLLLNALDERLRQTARRDTHALSVAFAHAHRPGRAGWAGARCSATRAAWIAALLATLNPFLTYYAQETRMYALVALLSTLVDGDLRRGLRRSASARWLPVVRGVAGAASPTPTTGGCSSRVGTVAALVPIWRQAADRRAVLRDALLGLRAHRGALPAVAADAALPGRAHRRAVVASARLSRPSLNGLANLLGGAAPAMALRARRGLRPEHDPAPGAAALAARPGGARAWRIMGVDGAGARVAGLAGLAGVVDPLLLGLRRPGAAARRRAGWRAAAGSGLVVARDPRRLLVQPAHRRARHARATPTASPS